MVPKSPWSPLAPWVPLVTPCPGSGVVDKSAVPGLHPRTFPVRADIKKHGLRYTTWPYRAPEICYGDAAFGCPADVWSIGVSAWEALHGSRWVRCSEEKQLQQTYTKFFGGAAVSQVFQHHPLYEPTHHKESKTCEFWQTSISLGRESRLIQHHSQDGSTWGDPGGQQKSSPGSPGPWGPPVFSPPGLGAL